MSKTSIIGANFLERFRSSDYKSSVYAIAEIIDNCVDAKAKNIEIITITKKGKITDIYFVDNGQGMTEKILSKCVVFSEGTNTSGTDKTGFFGMGLPNASLSQCRDFSVLCEIEGTWRQNRVDFVEMKRLGELFIKDVFDAEETLVKSIKNWSHIENIKTVVHWGDLDKLDNYNATTLMNRTERLMGRIHRYSIRSGISINFYNYSDGNKKPDISHRIIENDPMFLTKNEQWIVPYLHKSLNYKESSNPALSSKTYYSKFIDTTDKSKLSRSLFYKPDDAQQSIKIKYKGNTYVIDMIVSVAYKDIQKPGTREGGNSHLGKQFGIKVKGAGNYPSANISWVRNKREITCGNYSLFNVTQENMRFWSIELHYSTNNQEQSELNLLDQLLGLSNSKQHLKFIPDKDYPDDTSENARIEDKKQELIAKITLALLDGIKKASKIVSTQAREWSQFELSQTGSGGKPVIPGPTPITYDVLIDALGKGPGMTKSDIEELTKKIKRHLPDLDKKSIQEGVEQYSSIGIENIIIYCDFDERDLFQTDKYQKYNITLINTRHLFYSRILEPLKLKGEEDLLASLELLISSLSRSGQNNFQNDEWETIKEFYTETAKDLKRLLKKQGILKIGLAEKEDLEENSVNDA